MNPNQLPRRVEVRMSMVSLSTYEDPNVSDCKPMLNRPFFTTLNYCSYFFGILLAVTQSK